MRGEGRTLSVETAIERRIQEFRLQGRDAAWRSSSRGRSCFPFPGEELEPRKKHPGSDDDHGGDKFVSEPESDVGFSFRSQTQQANKLKEENHNK